MNSKGSVIGYTQASTLVIADEQSREPERRSRPVFKWKIFRRRPVTAVVICLKSKTSDERNQSMPTNADVFATILSEVTGKPKSDVADLLKAFRENNPGRDKFDAEISQQQYDFLLAQLRTERSGILNWLIGKGLHKP